MQLTNTTEGTQIAVDSSGAGAGFVPVVVVEGQQLEELTTAQLGFRVINAAPLALDDEFSTDEDSPIVLDVLLNDTDPDGDQITLISIDTSTAVGEISDNRDGTITYSPGSNFQTLSMSEIATDGFRYTIDDGNGGRASASVTITMVVNDSPVVDQAVADQAAVVGEAFQLTLPADVFRDPDDDPLIFTAEQAGGRVFLNG